MSHLVALSVLVERLDHVVVHGRGHAAAAGAATSAAGIEGHHVGQHGEGELGLMGMAIDYRVIRAILIAFG